MAYSDREAQELLGRIGAAFLSVFSEEDNARTSEFKQELKERFEKIAADWASISEIESSANPDRLLAAMLRGKIDALWNEIVLAYEQRGSVADRKWVKFMALILPSFGVTDFPSLPDPDAKMFMEMMARPPIVN